MPVALVREILVRLWVAESPQGLVLGCPAVMARAVAIVRAADGRKKARTWEVVALSQPGDWATFRGRADGV